MKKTLVLVSAVVLVHVVAISGMIFLQGCKTTKRTSGTTTETTPVMPPLTAPAASETRIETTPVVAQEPKSEETVEYIVKSGDSLGLIAKRHNISRSELADVNKIKDPNKIRVGQKLIIPKRAASPAPAHAPKAAAKSHAAKPASAPAVAAGPNEYVVQPGDSLSKIAARHGVKVSALREANKLQSDKVKIGQKLVIPAGAKKTEAAAEPATTPAVTAPAPVAAPVAAPEASVSAPAPAAPVTAPAAVVPAAAPADKATGSKITHTVGPNDDLSSIAKLYVVTVDDIVAANQLGTNRSVQVGQKLVIP